MWAWHADTGWGWWIFGPLMMLIFWGLVIWLFFAIFTGSRRDEVRRDQPRLTPRQIAERRLASGEITEEEFDRIVSKLGSGST